MTGNLLGCLNDNRSAALAPHTRSQERDLRRRGIPSLGNELEHIVDDMPFGRELRVEFGTDSIGPPTALRQRRNHAQAVTCEFRVEDGFVGETYLVQTVQIDHHKIMRAGLGRLE